MLDVFLPPMYAFVKVFLMLPSLLMNGIYALGPVVAPIVGMALCVAFSFIALRDKPDA